MSDQPTPSDLGKALIALRWTQRPGETDEEYAARKLKQARLMVAGQKRTKKRKRL
jgi:hypothetical protein